MAGLSHVHWEVSQKREMIQLKLCHGLKLILKNTHFCQCIHNFFVIILKKFIGTLKEGIKGKDTKINKYGDSWDKKGKKTNKIFVELSIAFFCYIILKFG